MATDHESFFQNELESESKVLGFSKKLSFSPRAKPGRIQNNDGSGFRILPAGRLATAKVHKCSLLISLDGVQDMDAFSILRAWHV